MVFLKFTFFPKFLSCDEIFAFLSKIGHVTNIFAFPEKKWSCIFSFSCKKLFILTDDLGFKDASRAGGGGFVGCWRAALAAT